MSLHNGVRVVSRDMKRSDIEAERSDLEIDHALDFLLDNVAGCDLPSPDEVPTCIVGFAQSKGFRGKCSACRGCQYHPELA